MTKDELTAKLEEHGLSKYEEQLTGVARPCIRLYLTKADNEADIPIGASKMGGRPDLPESFSWPFETERPVSDRDRFFNQKAGVKPLLPHSFVAQINLAEVSLFDNENLLPKNGILYFFYSAEQEVWGFDPRDSSGFKVLFYDGDMSRLVRTDFPADLPDYSRFDPASVIATSEISLPSWTSDLVPEFESEKESNAYYSHVFNDENRNKLFGFADTIQDEMETECEMVAGGGDYVGDGVGRDDPRRTSAKKRLSDWRLLLQVDSNEDDCGMMWGDVGRIYYWIRKDALLNRDFEKAWLILQCS